MIDKRNDLLGKRMDGWIDGIFIGMIHLMDTNARPGKKETQDTERRKGILTPSHHYTV